MTQASTEETPQQAAPMQAIGQAPPLVLTTYDEFTATGVWAESPTTAGTIGDTLLTAPDASTLVATITLKQPTPTTTLAAFDTSTHIAGAQPLLLAAASRTLDVASWQSLHPLPSGASYTDTASLLSQSDLRAPVARVGDLAPGEYNRLLEVPLALAPTLQALVRQWTTPGMTPLQEAQALAQGMRGRYTLVAQQQRSQVDGMTLLGTLLKTHKGNALTWATLHVLLCRAAGLPARLASAFNPGTPNVDTGISTVRARDATWLTQIATTAGWLHVGPLDQVVTQLVPASVSGGDGGSRPHSDAIPTPTPVSQRSLTPRVTPHPLPGRALGCPEAWCGCCYPPSSCSCAAHGCCAGGGALPVSMGHSSASCGGCSSRFSIPRAICSSEKALLGETEVQCSLHHDRPEQPYLATYPVPWQVWSTV